jgi:magnesium-transporting ATPase (P-type)
MAPPVEEPAPKKEFPWHAKTVEECVQELGLTTELLKKGLSTAEAQKRLEDYGPNKLSEKEQVTLLQRIWHQVANVLVAILVFVAIVSMVRALTIEGVQNIVSNWLQVALILFVIT